MGLVVLLSWMTAVSQDVERLSLHDAVALALAGNPHSLASSERIEVERGRFWRGISPPPPTVDVGYDYIPKGAGVRLYGERAIGVSQSIDFPTTIYFRGRQLSSRVSTAEAEHASTANAITLEVKLAYYTVLARQKKLELTEENLGIAEDFARKAEIRYAVGEATNLERLTAAVQRTQARSTVGTARNDLAIAFGELQQALGRGKEDHVKTILLTDSLVYTPFTENVDRLMEKAAGNPHLRAASFRVSDASIGRTLAWSSLLPTFNATYSRQTVGGNSDLYGVSLGVSVPVWFFLDQRGQIQEAAANESIAEHDLRSLRNSISMTVRNAYLEMENYERQITVHRTDILPQAEEVYRTARASYDAGEISYIEFLQARQLLTSSRSEYIDELARYCSSVAKLEYAVGYNSIF